MCRKNATKDSPKFPAWQAVFPMGRNYMQKLIEVEDGEMYSELEYWKKRNKPDHLFPEALF